MSNASKGSYFKARTKRWLSDQGWQVWDMEIVRWIYRPGQQPMPVKRDQLASDLGAMKGERIAFIQVKGGAMARGGTFPAARRAFAEFVFPPFVEQWILAWPPRARAPRIVQVSGDSYIEVQEVANGKARQVQAQGQSTFTVHSGAPGGAKVTTIADPPRHGARSEREA